MKGFLFRSVARSIWFSRKDSFFQVLIIALLSAIISGSLFTGYSVRRSLEKSVNEKLCGTDIIVSSGFRYFDSSLAGRLASSAGEEAVSAIESDGFCQSFSTGKTALRTTIFGIGDDFFAFINNDTTIVKPGTAAINSKLAQFLNIKPGDEIIVHFKETDPIPSNAPFSPSKKSGSSRVLTVRKILSPSEAGNFSTGLSQVTPMNIFINSSDLNDNPGKNLNANRIFITNHKGRSVSEFQDLISKHLALSDLGLSLRTSEKRAEAEIISDRIFIDSTIFNQVKKAIPSVSPVITYLVNSFILDDKSTPYSFVSALPPSMLPDMADNSIIINKWLSGDLIAKSGDTILLSWFEPEYNNILREKSGKFIVKKVIDNYSDLSDPSLMPDFPGIAGKTTCSGWDAGVPILLDKIRSKDEDYWNRFRGTPKAFISYKTGKELWGNNFGIATSLRFPDSLSTDEISKRLKGSFNASRSGFSVIDVRRSHEKAANEGVDFSTLFLGLGLFMIISCLILLFMAIEMFFESRKRQIRIYYNLGYRNRAIKRNVFTESMILSFTGALPGAFSGYLLNSIIIKNLNSVWTGAVQMNTLSPDFSIGPVLTGLVVAILVSALIILLMLRRFLKELSVKSSGTLKIPSVSNNLLLMITGALAIIILIYSLHDQGHSIILSFAGGTFLFIAMILMLRSYYVSGARIERIDKQRLRALSDKYFFFHPRQALTPVIFIAAGIFAIIITGANKQVISPKDLMPSGGTGGYMLFAESALPVSKNLATTEGRREFGLDETGFEDMVIEQAGRLSGDDASCLNLNHVSAPPLLGIDQDHFSERRSFSFASVIRKNAKSNPWHLLSEIPGKNIIYGIADQSSLEWGLKVKIGDTLKYKTEIGEDLKIVICAGLKSSVFQGYLLISKENMETFFPSISGGSVFLIDGRHGEAKKYIDVLSDRFSGYGFSVMSCEDKLASFFTVTNTYLNVFTILGVMGLLLGTAGMGIVLLRNFNRRRSEFALMLASGYKLGKIRRIVLGDYILVLFWGICTGVVSAIAATLPSLKSGNALPWSTLFIIIAALMVTGISALLLSVKNIKTGSLVSILRKE